MPHPTPDTLALLALGEALDASVGEHVPTCAACQSELAALQHAVAVGRTVTDADMLVAPSPDVWERIRAEVQDAAQPSAVRAAGARSGAPAGRAGRRWTTLALAAALALVVGVGAGFGISRVLTPTTGSAGAITLNALPHWPGANGTARVETDDQGNRTLVVTVELPPTVSVAGQMEVWLSDSRAQDMVAMGPLPDGTGRFRIPSSFDLETHPLVDVSLEPPNDPDPAHSDDSVVRGRLAL